MVGFVLGGLAIFIYGIQLMSDALKSIAGVKIREYIEKYTKNLFMSIIVGTVISAILHSSSAVTVISISLVRAGLMGLKQAIGITIGANIGTCVTSILIGLNIEQFSYYFVFIGVLLMFLAKRKKMAYVGKVCVGFGLIFVGLEMMSNELVVIAKTDWFVSVMVTLGKQPWFALLGATVATAIMQSSTAVIGIVQKLYITGLLTPQAGAAFIFGANVGTCMTALLASLGGSIPTKRAAWFHAIYNVFGALLGMLVLSPFVILVNNVNQFLGNTPEMYIAQAHFIFNIASTVLVIPFVNLSVRLLEKLIPGEEKGIKIENIDDLDDGLIEKLPAAALAVSKTNTERMIRNVLQNIELSKQYLLEKDQEIFDESVEVEALVNKYDTQLSLYLLKIAQNPTLSEIQTQEYYKNYQIVKQLEHISDQITHINDFYKLVYEDQHSFSEGAIEDLKVLYEYMVEILQIAHQIYDNNKDVKKLIKINKKTQEFHRFILTCQQNHFERMCQNVCENSIASSVILDIFSNIERIVDLSLSVANRTYLLYKKHDDKYLNPSTIQLQQKKKKLTTRFAKKN